MKIILSVLRIIIICVLPVSILFQGEAAASLAVGAQVQAGDFKLYINYDAFEEERFYDEGLRYIQDPSKLLFDLIAFFQAHYDEMANVDKNYQVKIFVYLEGPEAGKKMISVNDQDRPEDDEKFKTKFYRSLSVKNIRKEICSLVPVKKCDLGTADETFMFQSTMNLDVSFSNIILFGSFPSDSMPTNYVIRPPKGMESNFKKITMRRKDMHKYFEILE